ncbi:MAG: hypothetical protein GX286_07925 [Clostridiales bacterium]|jgi:uncharacterized membrane protein|nr:hypothetical protein [Clostridiales bacterium]
MNSNIYPLPFSTHLAFCLFSVAFFLFQYYRTGYKYQLLMAFAIPATLLIYISSNKLFFYSIGIFELIMLILVSISIAKEKKRLKKQMITANAALDKIIGEDNSEDSMNEDE